MKINKILIVPLLLGLVSIAWSVKEVAYAKKEVDSSGPPPNVMCYKPAVVDNSPETSIKRLESSLESLEDLHKKGQISEETYEQRKKDLLNQIKDQYNRGE